MYCHVSVVSPSCLRRVSVVSPSCLRRVSVMSRHVTSRHVTSRHVSHTLSLLSHFYHSLYLASLSHRICNIYLRSSNQAISVKPYLPCSIRRTISAKLYLSPQIYLTHIYPPISVLLQSGYCLAKVSTCWTILNNTSIHDTLQRYTTRYTTCDKLNI